MSAITLGVLLVVLCGVVEGVAQLFFKKSALVPGGRRLWVGIGVAFFIVQALLYTVALHFVDISTAFPIGSVSYVVVAVLSQQYLNERVTGKRWTGVALIMAGVTLLAVQA